MLCVVGTVLTAVPYTSFFASSGAFERLAIAALIGGAVAYISTLVLKRALAVVAVGAVGFAAGAVYVVLGSTLIHGRPQSATLHVGVRALVGGWAAMLSVGTPAGTSPRLIMDPYAITYVTAFTALVLTKRTRVLLAPAAVLIAAEVIALFFAGVQDRTHLEQCVGLLVLLLTLSVLRADSLRAGPRRARAGWSSVLIQAVAALVAIAVAVLGARALPLSGRRFDPSTLVRPALSLHPAVNPLADVRAQLQRLQPQELFTVAISGPSGGALPAAPRANTGADPSDGLGGGIDLIQSAALDDFNGSQWSSSAAYVVSGPDLAPGPAQPDATSLTEQITLRGLTGPFLPSIGRPSTVTGDFGADAAIGFDKVSGTLVTDAANLSGVSYHITSAVSPSSSALEQATIGTGPAYALYLALPPPPEKLKTLAATITSGAQSPYAKAVAIERFLRMLPYNLNAQPGESYAALSRMLDAADSQPAAAYTEQHVSAFAVLARLAGLPTRIAVGYALVGVHSTKYTVTTADAYAWDQVYFQDHGWADFDPTDPNRKISLAEQPEPTVVPQPSVLPSQTPPVQPSPTTNTPSPKPTHTIAPTEHKPCSAFPWLTIAGAAAGALLCAAVAVLLVRGSVRHRRRAARLSGGPSHRVAGAWLEVCDRLTRTGALQISPAQTVAEVARAAEEAAALEPLGRRRAARMRRRAAESLAVLAPLTDRAVFSAKSVSESEAQDALAVERRFRSEFRRVVGTHWVIRRHDRALTRKRGRK